MSELFILVLLVVSYTLVGNVMMFSFLNCRSLSAAVMGPAFGLLLYGLFEFGNCLWMPNVPIGLNALFLPIIILGAYCHKLKFLPLRRDESLSLWSPEALALTAIGLAILAFAWKSYLLPYGEYDAIAHWNLQAKFLLYGNGFDSIRDFPEWSLPDYPPLLPLLVTGGWSLANSTTVWAPIIIAAIFTIACTGAIAWSVPRRWAPWTLTVLLATPYFVNHASSQYADLPVAFCFAAALGIILTQRNRDAVDGYTLAGFLCGCAALLKNEGQAFLLVMGIVLVINGFAKSTKKSMRKLLNWLLGLALPVAGLIYFKVAIAPPNYLFRDRDWSAVFSDLTALDRMVIIAKHFFRELFHLEHWVLFLPVALVAYGYLIFRNKRRMHWGERLIHLVPALTFALYLVVYMTTPYDLEWQTPMSLPRLFVQLWPALLITIVHLAEYDKVNDMN